MTFLRKALSLLAAAQIVCLPAVASGQTITSSPNAPYPRGSISAPPITFGDTNTGYYSPAANQLGGTVAGVKSMQLGGTLLNTGFGIGSLSSITTGVENTVFGYQAGFVLTSGNYNVLVGKNAGANITTGSLNVLLGRTAGQSLTGSSSVGIGSAALQNTTSDFSIGIGSAALAAQTSGIRNIAIGRSVLTATHTGVGNVCIGDAACTSLTDADGTNVTLIARFNVAIGDNALSAATSGFENMAVGNNVMQALTTGSINTAMGSEALKFVTTGSNNSAYGVAAIQGTTTGSNNTAIGSGAGGIAVDGNANVSGSNNTFLGSAAKPSSATQQDHMTIIGADASDACSACITLGRTTDTVRLPNHLAPTGSAPTISSCGTSPTVAGSDLGGEVTTGTGTPTACTVSFFRTFTAQPYCTVVDRTAVANLTSYTVTSGAITLTTTAASSQKVVWTCIGN